mgnify:CR=1 FL=1
MNTDAPSAGPPLIELVNADIASASSPVVGLLTGVNWQLRAGDYWAVGGLQWSGKSDWLATVAGLQRPVGGELHLFGEVATLLPQAELIAARQRIGLVFENGGRLFMQMTVQENLALPLCYHRNCPPEETRDSVQAVLALTGLAEMAGEAAGQLNRNWRQRVALARALVLKPEVLLLDNPLAALDPRQIRWWLDMLDALNAGHAWLAGRPLTLVVTTDDLRPWRARARQFGLLRGQRWTHLGGQADVAGHSEPALEDLMAL